MTQPEAAKPGPTIHRIITDAIADPGQLTARSFREEDPSWQAGAVVLNLAVGGYQIVPVALADAVEIIERETRARAAAGEEDR